MPDNSARNTIDRAQQLANRVDPAWRGRTRTAIGRAIKAWAQRIPWPSLRTTEDFVLSGDKLLTFPERVGVVLTISDNTNTRPLGTTGHWSKRAAGVFNQDTGGNPQEWEDRGFSAFTSQSATDTTLQLAAGGSEAFEVRITGLVRDTTASGTALELQERFETMTMGGTSYTDTVLEFASFVAVEKEFGTSNWLKVRNPITSQVIAFLPEGEATVQHRVVQFIPVPPVNTVVRVEYYRKPEELHSENAPIDNSVDLEYLAWQAAGDVHWMLKEGSAANRAWDKAEEIIKNRLRQEKVSPSSVSTRPAFTYYNLELPIRRFSEL